MYLSRLQAASITDQNATNIKTDQNMGHFDITWPNDVGTIYTSYGELAAVSSRLCIKAKQHLRQPHELQHR
jgi:hypothetical protein